MYSKLNKTNNPKPPYVEECQKPKSKKYKQIIKYISYTNKHVKQPQIQKPNGGKQWEEIEKTLPPLLIAGGDGRRCLWVADQATQKTRSKKKLNKPDLYEEEKIERKGKSKQNREELTVDGSSESSAVVVARLGSSWRNG
jgi:hypothetical protein